MRHRIRSDDEYIVQTFLGIGQLQPVSATDDDKPEPAGRLFLPDPEQRHGWREYYVQKPGADKPGARPIGFGRP